MENIDLHRLANTGGAGAARKALMKAGAWDELAGLPARRWRVKLSVQVIEDDTETITVEARSADEAMDKAEQRFSEPDYYSAEALEAVAVDR